MDEEVRRDLQQLSERITRLETALDELDSNKTLDARADGAVTQDDISNLKSSISSITSAISGFTQTVSKITSSLSVVADVVEIIGSAGNAEIANKVTSIRI